MSAAAIAPIFGLTSAGHLLDRHSERIVIFAGAAIITLGAVAATVAPSYAVLLAALLLVGVGYSAIQPGGSKAVATWFPVQRGLAMGIRQAGLPLGGAFAAATLPVLADHHGWRIAFAVDAAVAIAGGTLFAACYRAPAFGATVAGHRGTSTLRARIAEARCYPWLRPLVVAGMSLVTAQFAIQTYLMLFLRDVHHIPLTRSAWLLVIVQIAGVVGRIVLAAWGDRKQHTRQGPLIVSILGTAAIAIALPLLPATTPLLALGPLAVGLGFFGFGWYGSWIAMITDAAPPHATGLVIGLAMSAVQIAVAGTPPVLGLIHDQSSSYLVLWWATAGALLLALPTIVRARNVSLREASRP